VTQLSLEADVEVVAERAQRIEIWLQGAGCLPTISIEPAFFRLVGRLLVYWDTSNGVLKAAFLGDPSITFTGAVSARGCPACPISSAVSRLASQQLGMLDRRSPFQAPFDAPLPLRFINLSAGDDSLATITGQVRQSTAVLRSLTDDTLTLDRAIPGAVLRAAKGLVMITHLKTGAFVTVQFGSGIVVTRLPSGGWSGPAMIQTLGGSLGPQAGYKKTDTVLVLFTEGAVQQFAHSGHQLKLGGEGGVAWGPLGREVTADAQLSLGGFSTTFAYSHSQGFYGGYAISGGMLHHRNHNNEAYYGRRGISPAEILDGSVPPPEGKDIAELHALLNRLAE